MTDPMRSYSVTVTMTPRQAIEAESVLYQAGYAGSARAFSAAGRIAEGLYDAGWDDVNEGTEDEPRRGWIRPLGDGARLAVERQDDAAGSPGLRREGGP